MSERAAENDAPGITYIDAPLPATVLALAYRMHAKWERLSRLISPGEGAVVSEHTAENDASCSCRAHTDGDADCTCDCPLYTHVGDVSDDGWKQR